MRLRCHAVGCTASPEGPFCDRCGAGIYDPVYVEGGRLDPLLRLWHRLRHWVWPRCTTCKKKLWPWHRRVSNEFCSMKCFDSWLPF